ncbi:MAG: helix-turn-helix domain-containing protein [Marinospirillum sp.]|uniref:RodZ domain-containing protein n=1 Tax=Marinospirillum sp. TaxID=2183934 RepID=UPI0019EBBBD1|nr:RodZ domain-containing protein [Marinospirillum sp.]MBE0505264.1 helix-turn-helix domain-containing protein [Marinospirillum sp.]
MTDQQQENQQHPDGDNAHQVNCSRPGELLKKAREAKGLSKEEVALKLNFLPAYVTALENEQFEPLHSTTFVKGYLRAYARFLGIDAEEVLRCFHAHYPEMQEQEKNRPVQSLKPEKNTSSLLFKLFSVLVVLALISIIIIWWQSRSVENLPGVSSQEVKVETLDGQTIIAPLEQPEAANSETETQLSDETPIEAADAPQQQPAEPESTPPPAVVRQRASPATPALPPVVSVRNLESGTDVASTTLGNDRLVALSFSGDCWVEVRDQTDRILHASLMREGEAIVLEGQPPFRMVFGYGHVASVYYRGAAYDFTSRIRPNGYASISID